MRHILYTVPVFLVATAAASPTRAGADVLLDTGGPNDGAFPSPPLERIAARSADLAIAPQRFGRQLGLATLIAATRETRVSRIRVRAFASDWDQDGEPDVTLASGVAGGYVTVIDLGVYADLTKLDNLEQFDVEDGLVYRSAVLPLVLATPGAPSPVVDTGRLPTPFALQAQHIYAVGLFHHGVGSSMWTVDGRLITYHQGQGSPEPQAPSKVPVSSAALVSIQRAAVWMSAESRHEVQIAPWTLSVVVESPGAGDQADCDHDRMGAECERAGGCSASAGSSSFGLCLVAVLAVARRRRRARSVPAGQGARTSRKLAPMTV